MANTFYNRIIRKIIVGFGNIFNDITLVRYNPDLTEAERVLVPITYAPKELYVRRLEEDPLLNKKVQIVLPRLSFELSGFTYDSTRKLNTNVKSFAQTTNGVVSQYNPVPYNFDFNLYLYVRNIDDGTQIMEHIMSYFTPDYTIKLNMIPEMGTIKEVPVVLNSASQEIDYEGDWERDTRTIIWTLNFTVKGYIFGGVSAAGGLIKHSITSIYQEITTDDIVQFTINPSTGSGEYQTGEIVYQGYSASTAVATGKVVLWNNNNVTLTNINGNFISSLPIKSTTSPTSYSFISYQPIPKKYTEIDIYTNPALANITDHWTANTIITEYN